MPQKFNASAFERQVKAAQRKAEQQIKKTVDDHNRQVDRHNRKVVSDYNRAADAHNRKVVSDYNRTMERNNRQFASEFNRRVQRVYPDTSTVRFTVEEQQLAERVQNAVTAQGDREIDVFLSYARVDGSKVAGELRSNLEELRVSVWFDEVAIRAGKSQALQMDQGLRRARAGVVLLTPAYVAGRFWTERELGALLNKPTLIPVLHGVTFEDVAEYSGILPDLAGFTTSRDTVADIAEKIAAAVLVEGAA